MHGLWPCTFSQPRSPGCEHRIPRAAGEPSGNMGQEHSPEYSDEQFRPAMDAVAFIVNPSSGDGTGVRIYARAAEIVRAHGIRIAAFETMRGEGARPAVEAALQAGFTDIWVIGGDGTIHQCLETVVEAGAVLGVIAGGTSSRFALETGPMPPDAGMRAGWMMRQPVRQIDLGECNGRMFAVRAGVGLEALAARLTEGHKHGLGEFAYLFAGIRALGEGKPVRAGVAADGERLVDGKLVAAVFANIPIHPMIRFAGSRRSDPTDGKLDAVIVGDEPFGAHLAEWFKGATRGEAQVAGLTERRAAEFEVEIPDGAEVHLDGESLGVHERLSVRCLPGVLKIRGLELTTTAPAGHPPQE